jgi:hypothetical protein
MTSAIIFDCEFLTAEGSPSRFWCGTHDPDPVVAQIGAVTLSLENDFPILDTLRIFVTPVDRNGKRYPLDPFFTQLTNITESDLQEHGVPLAEALAKVSNFASGSRLWSWGKDEFNMVAISCYVAGIEPPIPATNFANACNLLLKAGMHTMISSEYGAAVCLRILNCIPRRSKVTTLSTMPAILRTSFSTCSGSKCLTAPI